jgi:hypothetical protein
LAVECAFGLVDSSWTWASAAGAPNAAVAAMTATPENAERRSVRVIG